MNRIVLSVLLLLGVVPAVLSQQPAPGEVMRIVAQSQEALTRGDEKIALAVVQEGLGRFPNDPELQIQLARIHAAQKQDRAAIGLLNAILLRTPDHREAKLELAQVYGYRDNYRESNRLYREILAANPGDEAASLGLVHNLVLEGKANEARDVLSAALEHHPNSLELQRYNDDLNTAGAVSEGRQNVSRRVQAGSSFFADTSGNRSVNTSEVMSYQISRNWSTRSYLEETSLWTTAPGTVTRTIFSGAQEIRFRPNKYMVVRGGGGAVIFADGSNRPLYTGNLDLYPWKNLLLSGGYVRYAVAPTFDATNFNLITQGWRGRVDYHPHNFTLTGSFYFGHYSDGNHAEREYAELMKWFSFRDDMFSVGGGYAFHHLHFTEDLNHGYFSPNQYRSHLAAAGFRFKLGKIYRGEVLGYGGGELLENFAAYSPAGEVLFKNDFLLGKWDLSANYSHFHLIQTTGAFRADAVSLDLGYRF